MQTLMPGNDGSLFDWEKDVHDLMGQMETILIQDPVFTAHAFDPSEIERLQLSPKEIIGLLMGEAKSTLAMIQPYLRPGMRLLEVGGGVGIVYALLRARGFDIVSLEPGSEGFGDRHQAGLRVLELLGIDPGCWLRTGIEDFEPTGTSFDLVFSYFVLEHVPDLDRAFQIMAGVLSPDGVMVHQCPNYTVPFEPHYNVPLVPFKPEWTAAFFPALRRGSVWRDLRFTTVTGIKRLCARNGLRPVFRKGMSATAFKRVLADPVFRRRKPGFVKTARLLRATGMLKMLEHLPPMLDTPMQFTGTKMTAV